VIEIVDANDLDSLKRQLSYTFLDAYGNFDGANILFDCIVKATEGRIIKVLEPHRPTGKSVGGFLGVCSCGEAIDNYQEHLLALIKGEQK
jgi:hypothetical protein